MVDFGAVIVWYFYLLVIYYVYGFQRNRRVFYFPPKILRLSRSSFAESWLEPVLNVKNQVDL